MVVMTMSSAFHAADKRTHREIVPAGLSFCAAFVATSFLPRSSRTIPASSSWPTAWFAARARRRQPNEAFDAPHKEPAADVGINLFEPEAAGGDLHRRGNLQEAVMTNWHDTMVDRPETDGAVYATGWTISGLAVLGAIVAVWVLGI